MSWRSELKFYKKKMHLLELSWVVLGANTKRLWHRMQFSRQIGFQSKGGAVSFYDSTCVMLFFALFRTRAFIFFSGELIYMSVLLLHLYHRAYIILLPIRLNFCRKKLGMLLGKKISGLVGMTNTPAMKVKKLVIQSLDKVVIDVPTFPWRRLIQRDLPNHLVTSRSSFLFTYVVRN